MKKTLFIITFILSLGVVQAQKNIIDKIVAVVGEEVILKSDIENRLIQDQAENVVSMSSDYRASILENLLIQKLLLAQAKIDSITVTENEVEATVEHRIQYFESMLGSVQRVEEYFGKNLEEIKNELRSVSREKLISDNMQQNIVKKVRVTPAEVRNFYKKINKDSLPEIADKYEIQQIVIKPAISNGEKERIRERLREFREQITKGERTFNTLAVLYSEDPGSATRGGEIGYKYKNDMVPEFTEVAFSLKPDRVSKIVETEYGFHIMQLIDKQGERVNVRHILLQPKVSETEQKEALDKLDSIRLYITDKQLTFEEAAHYFSTHKQSKNNGGLITNIDMESGSIEAKIERGNIKGELARQINQMSVNDISKPFIDKTEVGDEYKIVKLKAFYPRHKANLEEDWIIFESMLTNSKRIEALEKWIKEKQADTYISIDNIYQKAKFNYSWIK